MSGNGVKLVAARRNTSNTTFATEQTIAEYPGDQTHLNVKIASNGSTINTGGSGIEIAAGNTGYAVSWLKFATTFPGRNWIYARIYNGASWSTSTQLTNNNDIGQDHDIASNGASYAVVATSRMDITSGNKNLESHQFNGSSWDLSPLKTVAWNGPSFTDPQKSPAMAAIMRSPGVITTHCWRS